MRSNLTVPTMWAVTIIVLGCMVYFATTSLRSSMEQRTTREQTIINMLHR